MIIAYTVKRLDSGLIVKSSLHSKTFKQRFDSKSGLHGTGVENHSWLHDPHDHEGAFWGLYGQEEMIR